MDLCGLPIKDVFDADEVPILKLSCFRESSAELQLGVAADINFSRGPDTFEIGVPSFKNEIRSGKYRLEPVCISTVLNAPFRLSGGGIALVLCPAVIRTIILKSLLPNDLWTDTLTPEVWKCTIGVDITQCQGIAVIACVTHEETGSVIVGGRGVEVTG